MLVHLSPLPPGGRTVILSPAFFPLEHELLGVGGDCFRHLNAGAICGSRPSHRQTPGSDRRSWFGWSDHPKLSTRDREGNPGASVRPLSAHTPPLAKGPFCFSVSPCRFFIMLQSLLVEIPASKSCFCLLFPSVCYRVFEFCTNALVMR
jgi:hypothetical protein